MQLTQLFPSLKIHTTYPLLPQTSTTIFYDALNQCWYEIDKSEISSRDALFLAQFLQQADSQNPWYVLLTQGIVPKKYEQSTIRVLQYTTKHETTQLQYAIDLYFMNDAILFEAAPQTFWIILLKEYSVHELEGFMAILENDFYMHGRLFIGQPLLISSTVHTLFAVEQLVFQRIQHYHLTAIYTFTTSIIFLLPSFLQLPIQQYLTQLTTDYFNEELITIITVLFQHNGNVSSSAKALHVHRNTLLYRIQRFSDETALDLKASEDLLLAYMAAQLLKLTKLS